MVGRGSFCEQSVLVSFACKVLPDEAQKVGDGICGGMGRGRRIPSLALAASWSSFCACPLCVMLSESYLGISDIYQLTIAV